MCAAVALETLKIYEDDRILDHVREVIPHFQQRVAELGQHPLVGEARGSGLIAALEVVANKETRESFAPSEGVASHVGNGALKHGVITRALGDTVNFCPPLIITRAEIDELFDGTQRALDDTLEWRKSKRA